MAHLDAGGLRAMTVWHRRAGKDLTAAGYTAKRAMAQSGMYWHFFPTFAQARRSIWEGYLKDGTRFMEACFPGFLEPGRPESVVARKNDQEMFLELKSGSIWRLMGSDKVESVGAGPRGVVFSEYALCRPKSWDLVRPMLRENGGWAWFITTPRGPNHAKELYESAGKESGWFRDVKTVMDTNLVWHSSRDGRKITPGEMMLEERAEGMHEALVRQEYLCDWTAANMGSVYGDLLEQVEKEGGLEDFEHERDGVHTSWDLGISDSTAIWFWRLSSDGIDVIDCYEAHGKPMSHYFDELEKRAQEMGYRYVKHWLPHDARARTLQTGASILDQFLGRYGSGAIQLAPELSLADGIQAARWLLQQNTAIHPRCKDGIEALRQYHYAYDEDTKAFDFRPEHDWSSHYADALRYLACVVRAAKLMAVKEERKEKPVFKAGYTGLTLDELWASSDERAKKQRSQHR